MQMRACIVVRLLAVLGLGCLPAACDRPAVEGAAARAAEPGAEGGASPAASDVAPAFEVVATDLEVPWDLTFAPDGRIFETERSGRIRVIEDGAPRSEPWATLDVAAVGEAGLTSVALAPVFAQSGHVYVLGTFRGEDGLKNRVVRLTDRGGSSTGAAVLVDDLPADRIHAGGALDFGPDGLLYITVGDATEPRLAQDPNALHGKLLRYRADGTPAPGNPVGGPVYALGLRNSQGLDWPPLGGDPRQRARAQRTPLGERAHGRRRAEPDRARRQLRLAGGGGVRRRKAVRGAAGRLEPGDRSRRARDLHRERLPRVAGACLPRRSAGVTGQEVLFEGELGRIRAVVMGPDGSLYFTTSNRDGRGDPAAGGSARRVADR